MLHAMLFGVLITLMVASYLKTLISLASSTRSPSVRPAGGSVILGR